MAKGSVTAAIRASASRAARDRRIGEGDQAVIPDQLRRVHLRGEVAVDVWKTYRVRIVAGLERGGGALLHDPDVDPRLGARPQDGDAHHREAGEEQEEARFHQ